MAWQRRPGRGLSSRRGRNPPPSNTGRQRVSSLSGSGRCGRRRGRGGTRRVVAKASICADPSQEHGTGAVEAPARHEQGPERIERRAPPQRRQAFARRSQRTSGWRRTSRTRCMAIETGWHRTAAHPTMSGVPVGDAGRRQASARASGRRAPGDQGRGRARAGRGPQARAGAVLPPESAKTRTTRRARAGGRRGHRGAGPPRPGPDGPATSPAAASPVAVGRARSRRPRAIGTDAVCCQHPIDRRTCAER